jgi:hypothetical protein
MPGGLKHLESSEIQQHDSWIKTGFTEAALAGIAANGDSSDIVFARPYLRSKESHLKKAAVDVVARFGNSGDVPMLEEALADTLGESQVAIAAAIMNLSENGIDAALRFIHDKTSNIAKDAFSRLMNDRTVEVRRFFALLLSDKFEVMRLRAVEYFYSHRTSQETLEVILSAYLSKSSYYYDVVTWLDRLIYAPSELRESYATELREAISRF